MDFSVDRFWWSAVKGRSVLVQFDGTNPSVSNSSTYGLGHIVFQLELIFVSALPARPTRGFHRRVALVLVTASAVFLV